MIELLLPAFLVSVVLLGIHSYFGLEIIRRGIIFTDLAIGQWAAFGSALTLVLWDGKFMYPVSLGFALAGGLLIGALSRRSGHQAEPMIGLMYASAIAGVFLLLAKSPHGMEEIQNLMAYDILFTPLVEVGKTALIYAGLGSLLYFTRKLQGRLRELIFFLSFAATVTSSVKMAGVLVVFVLLIGPALISLYFFGGSRFTLLWAWGLGILLNLAALLGSYYLDLPTGYSVVAVQALAALLVGSGFVLAGKSLHTFQISENTP
ncbi:metal ABC transporter permease [bacterium (Candidatus Blackallbacteria) CG17_big_fil_post_rev_8_21_14_2_50_48_46]|uniref:Metal ABC transporter permease n=1 Tax=bacterium (Candidatus Blackallbacteria) CG17_big_fil_post_rev_8_21_14_2_50_48_46 TaxID=2014261 RepID=A0A2M7FXJ5_9BACT|nr:MAG: ABC transporter [bacterium (Candidatus Blackallbacteria) CG18_big_fil_WC_8_21_14_2_50_49_26]PIW14007.1 MAG: metal ABC transporter permease [bacterium (Candidatus Blackallbacteria) CG17_big_fil_post_rev_8_21_14_2_50_48_46]PIW46859.1 MAG: metal ABC transporter permease [bacterium (Candidatus Blackallbacteria) CG13_big_fil_rev_8_21_14_2_50_49_14]